MSALQWATRSAGSQAGLGLLPLLERADRNLLLEQGSGSRRGEAALASFALGTQEAIRCGCAHGEQLPACSTPRSGGDAHAALVLRQALEERA